LAPRPTSKVSVPPVEADQPKLLQVGLIALVCFAIGMLWPTIWGATLVPGVPGNEAEDKPKAKPKGDSPNRGVDPTREVPAASLVPQLPAGAAEGNGSPRADVQKALVVNCRDDQDRKLEQCDSPSFDEVAKSRLEALAACPAAADAAGVLSIGFDLDFSKEKLVKISSGKSSTLDGPTTDALLECARREFASAPLQSVSHTHARYLIFYTVQFTPAGAPAAAAATADAVVTANGFATVIWNSARVRTQPDGGEVAERLLYGTRVAVTGRQGDWYRVRYDAKGNEGWVHRNALAM
jgi:Bacterial SH3 domain